MRNIDCGYSGVIPGKSTDVSSGVMSKQLYHFLNNGMQ